MGEELAESIGIHGVEFGLPATPVNPTPATPNPLVREQDQYVKGASDSATQGRMKTAVHHPLICSNPPDYSDDRPNDLLTEPPEWGFPERPERFPPPIFPMIRTIVQMIC